MDEYGRFLASGSPWLHHGFTMASPSSLSESEALSNQMRNTPAQRPIPKRRQQDHDILILNFRSGTDWDSQSHNKLWFGYDWNIFWNRTAVTNALLNTLKPLLVSGCHAATGIHLWNTSRESHWAVHPWERPQQLGTRFPSVRSPTASTHFPEKRWTLSSWPSPSPSPSPSDHHDHHLTIMITMIIIPSGEHTKSNGKIHHFSWEHPLFLWPFSIAILTYPESPFFMGKSTINGNFQ